MKTLIQRRTLALSLLCAAGLSFAAAAHASEPVSDLARLDGSSAHVGKPDPFLDGARIGQPDPYTDGARTGKPDPFTDGANVTDRRNAFTDGA
ncbi:hypothetical protein QO239_24560 [Cupriavidus taiwanensis]|uniref:Uncharacterized protein n=1 Tax=Cupriavidus taiwanensis TaxID=164546 RepID=A0A375BXC9_9BURK|nr:hypothetical protein [Cupriavidus taiwanensis]MDK3025775.1 hypothetical protein [Cupriavidus taiwanensis]SOY57646.1 conserved exported hypothetical protein [Cupriavidus taiwanensis]